MSPWTISRRLLAYLRPYLWPHFLGALLCMLIYSGSSGAIPYIVRTIVDQVFQKRDTTMLHVTPILIVVVFLLRGVVNFGQAYLSEYVGERVIYDLRRELDHRILTLPLSYFDRAQTGNLLSRVTADVILIRQALTEGAAAMLRDATTVVLLLGVAVYMDPVLALISLVVFPSVVLPLQKLSRKMRRLSRRGLDTLGGLSGLLQETIQGNRVVKAFGMEDYEKDRFLAENDRLLRLHLRAAKIKAFTTPMMEFCAACGVATVIWYGGNSVLEGGRSAGSFLAFITALMLVYDPFKKVVRTNNIVQTGLGAALRVYEVLDLDGEEISRPGHFVVDTFKDRIELRDVTFTYDRQPVIKGVSLELRRGEAVALVGSSGGGKSTLADLIPRFYEVQGGSIRLDGRDIREIDLRSLRSLISVVTQQTFLFNDTVRSNIAYGRIQRSEDDILAAARAANAHEFIVGLPEGYETVVGEMGVQLSGGQRQRIAIARALLKDAPILILDEATSALDSESERLVQVAIERLMQGRTTLVIAHRLSTIRRVNRIAVVDSGRIVEVGTHDELLKKGKVYKRFYDIQFEGDAVAHSGGTS